VAKSSGTGGGAVTTTQDLAYNAANEITATGYTYDAAGNLTQDSSFKYIYDAWNRLAEVHNASDDMPVVSYSYDGLGRRIEKCTYDSSIDLMADTQYFYDTSWRVVEERRWAVGDEFLAMSAQYLWRPGTDTPIMKWADFDNDSAVEGAYYTTDAFGKVTALIDCDTGAVVERYVYDPYGAVIFLQGNQTGQTQWAPTVVAGRAAGTISAVGNEILYAGYRYDPETSLYQLRNRQYDPSTGRFLQRDPSGYNGTMNAYGYCGGNPVTASDPMGLGTLDENKVMPPTQYDPVVALFRERQLYQALGAGESWALPELQELERQGRQAIEPLFEALKQRELEEANDPPKGGYRYTDHDFDYQVHYAVNNGMAQGVVTLFTCFAKVVTGTINAIDIAIGTRKARDDYDQLGRDVFDQSKLPTDPPCSTPLFPEIESTNGLFAYVPPWVDKVSIISGEVGISTGLSLGWDGLFRTSTVSATVAPRSGFGLKVVSAEEWNVAGKETTAFANKMLEMNPGLAREYLSEAQYAAGMNDAGVAAMNRGIAVENYVAELMAQSPRYSSYTLHIGGAYSPDFMMLQSPSWIISDVTTNLGVPAHWGRWYGPYATYWTYDTPQTFTVFPKL
jgi:RHS repeat-associated protein